MAEPQLITITGKFTRKDGTPESGTVEFQVPGLLRSQVYDENKSPGKFIDALDEDGTVSLSVWATDDPNWTPANWTYKVIITLSSFRAVFNASIPIASPSYTLDMADILPALSPSEGQAYAPISHTHEGGGGPGGAVDSVNGRTGAVVLTKSDVGLSNVDNTTDANKPVSSATQTALNLKANLASPTFTGTVSGITKSMVGLGNVDNTSDANKPISTATQTALDGKSSTGHTHTGSQVSVDTSGFEVISSSTMQGALTQTDAALLKARSTGVVSGGALTSTPGSGTVSIAAGVGDVLDISNPAAPNYIPVSWNAASLDLSAQSTVHYVYVTSGGVVSSTTSVPSLKDYRSRIYLHRVSIIGGVFSAYTPIVQPVQHVAAQIRDIWAALGQRKLGLTLSPGGANLTIAISSGSVFSHGANFYQDAESPSEVSFAAKPVATFRHVNRSGTQGTDTTSLDIGNYDAAGVITAIGGAGTRATIFTVKMFPSGNGNVRIFYGQTVYNTVADALAALQGGTYNPTLPDNYSSASTLGWIIAQRSATNLGDGVQVFVTSNIAGLIGGSIASASIGSLIASNNLSDVPDKAAARANLVLGNVDNTSDANKPVSTAQQAALNGKPDVYQWNGTTYALVTTGDIFIGPSANDPATYVTVGNGSVWVKTT